MFRGIRNAVFLTIATVLLVPTGVLATDHHASKEISEKLKELRSEAATARRHAAELESLTRNRVSWETHAYGLTRAKESVNSMGAMLADLEDMKSETSTAHDQAIEDVRPKLQSAASGVGDALKMIKQDRAAVRSMDFKETLRDIWKHSDALYSHLDAHLDYHDAKSRLDRVM